jgi:hypothetical protein
VLIISDCTSDVLPQRHSTSNVHNYQHALYNYRLSEQAAETEALLQQIDEHRTAAARHTAAATALNAELEARTRALSARTNEVEGLQRELEARTLEGR